MFSIILAILYPIAIQYERRGIWYVVLPITFFAFIIDVIANYTELAILTWDFPRSFEFTFSQRLSRLKRMSDWRGKLCLPIANILDKIAPSGKHVP